MIAFNKSNFVGNEVKHIMDTLGTGEICGDRRYCRLAEKLLNKLHPEAQSKLTTSCTSALEVAALALGIDEDAEVIVPSYTFVSTASAFAMRGARIRFIDSRPDTLNLDERLLEGMINERTRAIVPVHYAGVSCEMETIMSIANHHGIPVVEDNAHGLFGTYQGQALGTFGSLSTLSFHETKNITCGEGGAIVVNDDSLLDSIEIIREKGTNRSQFFRGQVDKYSWQDLGSSYVMSDVLAAFLYGQLENWESIQDKRRRIWNRYNNDLKGWAEATGVRLPIIPAHCEQTYHMFYLLFDGLEERTSFMKYMKGKGVHTVFHYLPLEQSNYAKSRGWDTDVCPVSNSISERLVRLPLYPSMSDDDLETVITAVVNYA